MARFPKISIFINAEKYLLPMQMNFGFAVEHLYFHRFIMLQVDIPINQRIPVLQKTNEDFFRINALEKINIFSQIRVARP